MSFWQMPTTTINETCSCGAKFHASGPLAATAAAEWRWAHNCKPKSFRTTPGRRWPQ